MTNYDDNWNEWSEWVDNQRQKITAETCASLRLRLVDSTITLQDLADDAFPNHTRHALGHHARGKCRHDVDVPPVTQGWVVKTDE